MSDRRQFFLVHQDARRRAMTCVADAPEGYSVTVQPPARTKDQNARLWATLTDVADQVEWHGQRLSPAEFKDIFTAALKRQKVVPGMDGGFVVLGSSTSRMSKAEMSDLLELINAFAAERGIVLHDEVAA
jgi:hypothetical protein